MKTITRTTLLGSLAAIIATCALAQDWPQWRGANRDAKAADFKAPKNWPKELTQKWKVIVGEGVATPSLVGDKFKVKYPLLTWAGLLVSVKMPTYLPALGANGFEVEDLIEVQAPVDAEETRFPFVDNAWARRWPSEEIWKARKR